MQDDQDKNELRINVLGETEVRSGGRVLGLGSFGGVKTRQILEILVLHQNQSVSKERLADLLWEGQPPRDYMATLESYVSVLRGKLQPGALRGESVVVTGPGTYALDRTRASLDVDEFDRLVCESVDRPARERVGMLSEALDLVRGPLLCHELYGSWAQAPRTLYAERVIGVLVSAAELSMAIEDFDTADLMSARALRLDPLSEVACQLSLRAHWAAGRKAQALKVYESFRRGVRAELGVEPGEMTRTLYAALLAEEMSDGHPGSSGELQALVNAVIELYHRCRSTAADSLGAVTTTVTLPVQRRETAREVDGPGGLLIDLVARAKLRDAARPTTAAARAAAGSSGVGSLAKGAWVLFGLVDALALRFSDLVEMSLATAG